MDPKNELDYLANYLRAKFPGYYAKRPTVSAAIEVMEQLRELIPELRKINRNINTTKFPLKPGDLLGLSVMIRKILAHLKEERDD